MIVVTHWWVFLIVGVVLLGYAIVRQVIRVRNFWSDEGAPFVKDMGNIFAGHTYSRPRPPRPEPLFAGIALQLIAGFLGSLSLLIGFIGLVIAALKN